MHMHKDVEHFALDSDLLFIIKDVVGSSAIHWTTNNSDLLVKALEGVILSFAWVCTLRECLSPHLIKLD